VASIFLTNEIHSLINDLFTFDPAFFLSLVVLITAIKQSEKFKRPLGDESLTEDKDTESKK
jgi:hypothetical protein